MVGTNVDILIKLKPSCLNKTSGKACGEAYFNDPNNTNQRLKLEAIRYSENSLCPLNVQCIQQGSIQVVFELYSEENCCRWRLLCPTTRIQTGIPDKCECKKCQTSKCEFKLGSDDTEGDAVVIPANPETYIGIPKSYILTGVNAEYVAISAYHNEHCEHGRYPVVKFTVNVQTAV